MSSATRNVALVIGNGSYVHCTAIEQARNDAAAIGAALEGLKWETKVWPDCNAATLREAFHQFADELERSPPAAALFYYSGHGIEIDGENFAVPVDFDPSAESAHWGLESVQALVEKITRHAGVRIIVLDACRDDPVTTNVLKGNPTTKSIVLNDGVRTTKQVTPSLGLAAMHAADNTFLAFAAAPGQVAYTGSSNLSPFTNALVDHLDAVDLPIWNVTARVRQQVIETTNGRQIPWNNESLLYPFFFNPGNLLLFMGTAMALLGLIVSVIPYSLLLWARADSGALLLSAMLPVISLAVLLMGMQSAYARVRGEAAQSYRVFIQSLADWRDHAFGSLRKGVLGGYLGAFFGSYLMAYSYHDRWARMANTSACFDRGCDPLEPLGKVMLEITVTTVLTAGLLGFLTLFLSRTMIGRVAFSMQNRIAMRLSGTVVGGLVTGALAAPLITVYFGLKNRPEMTPDYLLPGCVLGAAFLVFSIVNFDLERMSLNRLWGGAKAAFAALALGAVAALAIFGPLKAIGIVQLVTKFMESNSKHIPTLLLGGLAYGLPVGIVLGLVVGAALILTERFTGKPVAF